MHWRRHWDFRQRPCRGWNLDFRVRIWNKTPMLRMAHYAIAVSKEGSHVKLQNQNHTDWFLWQEAFCLFPICAWRKDSLLHMVLKRLKPRINQVRPETAANWKLHHGNAPSHSCFVVGKKWHCNTSPPLLQPRRCGRRIFPRFKSENQLQGTPYAGPLEEKPCPEWKLYVKTGHKVNIILA